MAIVNGFDLDLLNKVADGYEAMDGTRLGLKAKEGISAETLAEAKAALQELMPNGLIFNLGNSVEPRHADRRQQMRDMIDAINNLDERNKNAEAKTKSTAANDGTPRAQERMAALIGEDYYKYNFKFENGRLISEDAPQEVMLNVYARLRDAHMGITYDVDNDGKISLRALRPGEKPVEINNNSVKADVQPTVDPTSNNEYKNFMDADNEKATEKTDATKTNTRKNEAPTKYELALADKDNMKTNTNEETDEDDINDVDALVSKRLKERFHTAEGAERLTDLAKELNTIFTIDGNILIAKEGITAEDIDFANTSLEYFYPTTLVMDDAGKLVGLAPLAGYDPLAQIVYSTMREAAKAQDFADKMAEKKAAQDALIQVEPIDYADYVNDYIYTNPSNTSDENEVLYNAIKFAALQAVKPATERKKYSEIIQERGDESVYTTRNVIERDINALDVAQRTAYANALNDVREAVLDALPPKTLVEFQEGLSKQLADENLSAEEREELISKLDSVQSRMDEMIIDVADEKVVFNDLQLPEHYDGLSAVINMRMGHNPKAREALGIMEAAIANYDNAYGLEGLTGEDAKMLMDRSNQADDALDKMGFTQVLGRKLKNVVSSNKLSTEREFTISAENDQLLRGILYTDEKDAVVPQMDENGNVFEDSLISHIKDMAVAYAYNKAVLGEEKITRESIQADVNAFIYSTAVNMVLDNMNAKGTPVSREEAKNRVQDISPENPYQVPLSAVMNQIVTQTQQMVGLVDRMGQKIGRDAPVLHKMHDQFKHLDTQMANSRFKNEYVKSNRLLNTVKKLGTMAVISAAYGLAFNAGGAVLGVGLIAGMTAMRTLAGYAKQKRQARRDGIEAKSFMKYLWSEKAQIAASAASITAAAGGLAWLSYSVAGLNFLNNFRSNLNRDKKAGQGYTTKDGIMGGIETALPMGVSLAMNIAMGGIFADRGDPDASFMDNISNTFSDAFAGIKDVFGFGDAAAGVTADATVMDNTAAPTDAAAPADASGADTSASGSSDTPLGTTEQELPPVNAHTVVPPTTTETIADTVAQTADQAIHTNSTDATSGTTSNGMPRVEDLPDLNTQTGTPPLGDTGATSASANTGTDTVSSMAGSTPTQTTTPDTASNTPNPAQTVNTVQNVDSDITVPHPDLENQTPPPDATFIQSPEDYAAEIAAKQAAEASSDMAANTGATDTTSVQNNPAGSVNSTSAADTAGETSATTTTNPQADTTTAGTENIPDAQAFNHTYDQAAHQHADARIHGQGINYKLDYNDTQLNNALDQIRTIGSDYPQMNSAAGQSNAEILMYKLNQIDQLLAPDTDIVTPEGRVEAQALYGHKMPDGSYYGPHDLRADLLAGKDVDPQIAAEIFAKIEPHIDATGHHIGDIHNFKEAGTWSYRQTGVGGYTEDLVPPANPEFDGVYGHLDESGIPSATDDNTQSAPIATDENDTQGAPVPPISNAHDGQDTPVVPVTGIEQNGPQTPTNTTTIGENDPKGAPFVPYIPYDKPIKSKVRRVLNDRIGAWMGPVKRAFGIKDKPMPEQDKAVKPQTDTQVKTSEDKRPIVYTNHNVGNEALKNDGQGKTGVNVNPGTLKGVAEDGTRAPAGLTNNPGAKNLKVPQGPGPKRLVVQESDLPKDPYFNISPISENVERDVNGAWVADFREGAPKINRTLKTANAEYVIGKLPNAPQKGEIEPTVIPMGMSNKPADKARLDNRAELPEPRKELPNVPERDRRAIRLGTEQVNDQAIPMDTQEQRDAFKHELAKGNVPKHIREVLEEKARQSKQPRLLLENKEGKKLSPKQAEALLNKYRDVTAAVDSMKQAPVTQNTAKPVDMEVRSSKGRVQKPQQTQTGTNGHTADANAAVWKHVTRNHKEP